MNNANNHRLINNIEIILWAAGDLIEDAYKELLNIDFKG